MSNAGADEQAGAASLDLVRVRQVGSTVWLGLHRRTAKNALSRALVSALRLELAKLVAQADLTAVVIADAEGKDFCAGADLKERLSMSMAEVRGFLDELGALLRSIEDFPRPVVAAISGLALGGGLEIALACDIRLADDTAVLGLPEVRLGIIPGAGGTQRLSRLCGIAVAKELILCGRRIDAATALRLGIVSQVVPAAGLPDAVAAVCAELAQAGPLALAQAKQAIDQGFGKSMAEALAIERHHYEVVLASDDRNEGLRAFAEKRPPTFRGR